MSRAQTDREGLRILHGGRGHCTVLLLHGLGATADVWLGVIEQLERSGAEHRWLAPDLPGHGRSSPLDRYSSGTMAAALAALLDRDDDVTVLGHSLGGVLGLTLATGWFGVDVRRVVGLGIKVAWTPEDRGGMAAQAGKAPREFATREEAVARYLRTSGLDGLVAPDDARLEAGVTEQGGSWRLALDQRAYELDPPEMPPLLAAVAAGTDVTLARGEHDRMVSDADLAGLVDRPVILSGLGHNAQVEDPAAVLTLFDGAGV